jgi:hypothetical protein
MRLKAFALLLPVVLLIAAPPASAQSPGRDATRAKLSALLASPAGRTDANIAFRQSTKQPYNFIGSLDSGLTNADSLEIVISVTPHDTIGFRVYPHYKGNYINLNRATDANGLMRKLLNYSDENFLYWGADEESDVFSGYTVTLESGFPDAAIVEVLRSIHNTDKYVGELRHFIDGSAAR